MGATSTCRQIRTLLPLPHPPSPSCRELIFIVFSTPSPHHLRDLSHSCIFKLSFATSAYNQARLPSYNMPPASTPHLPHHSSCPFSLLQSHVSEKVKISLSPRLLPNSLQFGSSPSHSTEFSPRSPRPFHPRSSLFSPSVTWLSAS